MRENRVVIALQAELPHPTTLGFFPEGMVFSPTDIVGRELS